ncbi:hypothetical protein [Acidovorax sp. RAC01]|uniref:hypothetical protein n=1 Tax=Acidovorax sp. RAC01 TaxID=1842533 RepID=UPI00083E71A6|nr:hypothetical protein [Acidovorax sp. RAC01]AOG21654.1 putative transmembrane protein [Acidovorax sp. RAC01]
MLNSKLGLWAILVELGAWAGPALLDGNSETALASYLVTHAVASVLLALFTLPVLAAEQTRPRLPMIGLMAVCSYVVPVVGFMGVLIGTLVLRFYRASHHEDDFKSLQLPEFDLHQRMQSGFRQTGLRAVLSNSEVPTPSRMRAMVALQHISGRISSPLLRNVLNDASEDLRLLAYGMLDSLERNISRAIDKELDILQKARETEGQDALGPVGIQAAEKLSALYWELVYQNLAQGDMRDHAIRESLRYCEMVLAQQPHMAQHTMRRGVLLHACGRLPEAAEAYALAEQQGLPATRVLPYLAELSFEQRDFDKTRQLMQQLDEWSALPKLRPVIDYWSAR